MDFLLSGTQVASNDYGRIPDFTVMTLLASGNVGIGTTSPVGKLEVSDQATPTSRGITVSQHTTDIAAPLLSLRKSRGTAVSPTAVANGDYTASINAQNYEGASWLTNGTLGYRVTGATSSGNVPGQWFFAASSGHDVHPSANGTIRMVVGSDGNVGIGTTSPGMTLDVASSKTAANITVRAYNTDTSSGTSNAVLMARTDFGGGDAFVALNLAGITNWYIGGDRSDSGKLKIGFTGAAPVPGLGDKVTIDTSGNVGIGTTAPTAALEIVGNLKVSGTVTQSGPMIYSTSTSSITQIPTTWTSISSLVTLSDNLASGISRTNSTFTFPTAGVYFVMATLVYVNNSASQYVGLRMRRTNGTPTTLVQNTSWAAATTGSQAILQGLMSISANDTVDFQHIASGSASIGWGSTNLGGENTVTVSITIYKM
jgi:hypothetical protein